MEISRPANPYVGPSAFTSDQGHLFFGRDRESKKLLSLISSTRVALFYAPSGAGKTSLLNARIVPALRKKGAEVLPIARVGGEIPHGLRPANSYVFNVLSYLSETEDDPNRLEGLLETSLVDFFNGRGERRPRVMILDQFEEIITVQPHRPEEREELFQQVREALESVPLLTVVFSLREDHVAGLDRYAPLLPDRLRDRFRMERLGAASAVQAVRGPAEAFGRPFTVVAAERLVDNLRQERIAGSDETVAGELVEPVQLQVACFQLWENLRKRPGAEITEGDVEAFGDVDSALLTFFDAALKRVARESEVSERKLVRFFAQTLITSDGIRGQVHRGAETTDRLPNVAVDLLAAEHLIRSETARGGIWYELVHDRFIEPILASSKRRQQRWRWVEPSLAIGMILTALAIWSAAVRFIELRETQAVVLDNQIDEARTLLEEDPPRSLQLAYEAAQNLYDRHGVLLPKAEAALRQALYHTHARRLWSAPSGQVSAIAVSADGGRLATGQTDGAVILWDGRSGKPLSTFHRHKDGIIRLALAPRGEALATLSYDNTAKVWDVSSAKERFSIDRFFQVVAFSRDGARLATAVDDVVEIWDARSGAEVETLVGHTDKVIDLSFSSDSKWLATASDDGTTRLWNLASGMTLQTWIDDDCGRHPYTVAFNRDATTLAIATLVTSAANLNPEAGPQCQKSQLSLWDVGAGVRRSTFDLEEPSTIFFTSDGKHIAAAAQGGKVKAWNLEAGQGNEFLVIPGNQGYVAVSDNGRILAIASKDKTVVVWDLLFDDQSLDARSGPVRSVAFAPSGRVLATAGAGGVRLWDVETLATLPLAETGKDLYAVAFSGDGGVLAAGGKDGKVRLWDTRTHEPLHPLESGEPALRSLAFQPGGRLLVTAGKTIRIWDVDSGEERRQFRAHTEAVVAVAFHPSGEYFGTASFDRTAGIWDLSKTLLKTELTGPEAVTAIAFSPDGKGVATGSLSGVTSVYEMGSGSLLYSTPAQRSQINAVTYSPKGKHLVTASGNGAVIVWDSATGQRLLDLPGPNVAVNAVSFDRDGGFLAVARKDGTICLEVMDPKQLLKLAARRRSQP